MENIINDLSTGYDGKKREFLTRIVQRPDEWEHFIIKTIQQNESEYADFKQKFQRFLMIGSEIFINYGEYGSLNCGRGMDHYDEVKETIDSLWDEITPGTSYEIVLKYLLLPIRSLPSKDDITEEDKPRGERLFSTMCLNLAVKLSLERMSFVKGYTKRGEEEEE